MYWVLKELQIVERFHKDILASDTVYNGVLQLCCSPGIYH